MTLLNDGFDEPSTVSNVKLAFPGSLAGLLPEWAAIPENFRRETGAAREWTRIASRYCLGLEIPALNCRPGITSEKADRHLRTIAGSFEPKHEHKIAGLAWLMSRWLELGGCDNTTIEGES